MSEKLLSTLSLVSLSPYGTISCRERSFICSASAGSASSRVVSSQGTLTDLK